MVFFIKQKRIFLFFLILLSLSFLFGTRTSQTQERQEKLVRADSLQIQAKKLPSPKGAMFRALAFPGWGQWYNGKKIKSVLVFLTETGIVSASFYWDHRADNTTNKLDHDFYIDNRNLAYWYLGAAILLSMADSYVDAHLAGFDVSPDLGFIQKESKFAINLRYHF